MKIKKLIEKIEGEAELDFTFEKGQVEDVRINFGFYRGIEEIMRGKDPRDALVITPRVCGICNHAHLIAAVRALEDGYAKGGKNIELTSKAKDIREFTLACELIQNHIKWFYMTIFPQLEKLVGDQSGENYALKASYVSSTITKALAIFAGQWPHSSYAVPGGVTCDPTYVDVMQAENLVDETIRFFEQVVVGMPLDQYLSIEHASNLSEMTGDLGHSMMLIGVNGMSKAGQSHDRFMVLSESMLSNRGKSLATSVSNIDHQHVVEKEQSDTTAKAVSYKERLFEVGPLARAMVAKRPIIKSLHKLYKDSILTRIFARVHEVGVLLHICKDILRDLKIDEPSCTLSGDFKMPEIEGTGVVEAARGSLMHKTRIKEGKVSEYQIIVPTQWNLSHGSEHERGVAVEAMVGSSTLEEANFIFRTFDVCSVCTTQ